MLAYPGQHLLSVRTQDPVHELGARVEDQYGRAARYGRVLSALTEGQLAAPRIYATITSGITAALDTATFTSSGSTFTKRVQNNDGYVTTWEAPARGSILHVADGTGKQQFARVMSVLSTTKLGIKVIGRADGTWGTALAATDTVRIIEPVLAPYDNSSHTVAPFGVALATLAADDMAFFGCTGLWPGLPNSVQIGARLITGTTAGQMEPLEMSGTATWDPGSIEDGNEEAKEITVTGAALGDLVVCSFSLDVTDLVLRGAVTAANTVTAILANNTGGAIDIGSGTVRALVRSATFPYYEVGTLFSPAATAAEKALVNLTLPESAHGNWLF